MSAREEQVYDTILRMIGQSAQAAPPAPGDDEAEEFAWDRPWRFTAEMVGRLGDVAHRAAASLAKRLHQDYIDEHEVDGVDVALCFGGQLKAEAASKEHFLISLDDDAGRRVGYLKLPPVLGMTWVERQLGSRGLAEDVQRDLSALETVLMVDAVGKVVDVFATSLGESHGPAIRAGGQAFRGDFLLPGDESSIFATMEMRFAFAETVQPLVFVLDAETVAPVCDPSSRLPDATTPAADRMKGHVERVELAGEVRVGQAELLLRDIMALVPGDVLVLGRECEDPIDLDVEGTLLARGYAVQAGENYGFQVAGFYDRAEIVARD